MKATYTKRILAAIISLTALSAGALAQQTSEIRPKPVTAAVVSNAAVPPAAAATSESTERERLLLDRIEKLERRLAEIEARSPSKPNEIAGSPSGEVVPSNQAKPGEAGTSLTASQPATPVASTSAATSAQPTTTATNGVAEQEKKATKPEPFAFADFTWLTGNPRTKESPISTPYFTGEFRSDVAYHHDFNHPKDNTISGSSEVFRSAEVQLTHLGIGGDFHWQNVRGRILTQLGMYSQTQPRNDPSTARGQWNLDNAYRYMTEAYGGYHFDKMNGINVDAGIFLSYIGLWSFYNFDNWTYQPSFVSSNTPWFFTGVRVQIFVNDKLKLEPWFINGWQTYGKFNKAPGMGGQIAWRPTGNIAMVFNNYWGQDTLGNPGRKRIHTDDSIQVKYLDKPENTLSKAAFSFTFDAGCEYGGGVSCTGGTPDKPSQYFIGFMAYNRFWFDNDKFGLTLGGGAISNPGRYLVLLPPVNGATAFSGTPYFTANPGDKFRGLDGSVTFDYMPSQFLTWRLEYNHRTANVNYYSGPGGVTPPGGNQGPPGSFVPGFAPDLRKFERRFTIALLVKL